MRIYCCLVALLISGDIISQANWELVKEKNGIKVYTQKVENKPLEEVKIITQIKAPVNRIVQILEDIPHHTQWMYGTKKSELIPHKDNNATHYYHYQIIDMPFPTKDRDVVVDYLRENKSDGSTFIRSIAKDGLIPIDDSYQRITQFLSSFDLTPLDENNTSVEYFLSADPGGNLPHWIINLFTTKGPYQTMVKLKERAEKK